MSKKLYIFLSLLLTLFSFSFAAWQNVAPGIDYSSYTIAGPVRVFVARMSRDSTNCVVDSMLAQGRLNKTGLLYNGRETVSGMANRYNETINYWGEGTVNYWGTRSQVVAAINGDGYISSVGTTFGGQIQGGWFAKRFMEYNGSGFVWKLNRTCFLGGNVRNGEVGLVPQLVAFAQSTATITRLNTTRSTNELVLYTPQYGPNTYTDSNGTEVVVQMTRPNLSYPERTTYVRGTVIQVLPNFGSTPIPFDSVVLSGNGTATTLLSQCTIGQEARVYMHIQDYGTDGAIRLPNDQDWGKVYASIGGGPYCVISSQVPSSDWAGNAGANVDDPRTAVAFNSSYIYFVVVDGRNPGVSIGMTYTDLGNFCKDTLGAEFAVVEDGGGSSTLWVNGEIKNHPSDPSGERLVANGLMIVNVLPMSKTLTFVVGNKVKTSTSAELRLGPGTNYNVLATAAAGQEGFILSHAVNGVYATGQNWWKWQFGSIEGWTTESALELVPTSVKDWNTY